MNEHLKRAIWDRLPQNEQEVLERLIAKIEQQTKADLTVGDEIVVLSVMRHRVKQLKARGPQEATAQAWQPMATCVDTHDAVLLWVQSFYQGKGGHIVGSRVNGAWLSLIGELEPSAWQPLPAPPVAASGAEGDGR